ncbi:MAG: DUF4189 domain-containing protein [Terracidiphilus sp.]
MAKIGMNCRFVRMALALGLVNGGLILFGGSAHAQDEEEPSYVPMETTESTAMSNEEACIEALGYVGCDNLGKPGAAQHLVVVHWAALALSPTTMTAGASHGQNSQDEAEQTAVRNCRRNGATDCKVLTWNENYCVGLAESYSDKSYGFSTTGDRDTAAANALARCRSAGGKQCIVVVAPCAGDDILWSSPMPLPTGVSGGKVDPVMVGTWELERNPGRWIWRVAANGTYEFHSETDDNAPSNAGTFTANAGHYTLHAISTQWDDVGTYTVRNRNVVVATGKLGTGTWNRIAGASSTVSKAPAAAKPTGPPIRIRK